MSDTRWNFWSLSDAGTLSLCHNMCDMRKRIIISTTMKKTNKIIPLDVRGTTKAAPELTSQELEALQYMKKCGKLDMVNVQKQADMIKRNEYLSMNPWKISEPKSDKFWRGYIPDKSKPNGRRQIKRTTRKGVEDAIIDYWKKESDHIYFSDAFQEWKDIQELIGVSGNTLLKYKSDYKRFFSGTDFEKMDIRDITSQTISVFMIQTIKCLNLKPKDGAALWGIINGVMKNAKINRQIPENPCEYINTRLFQKHYDKSKKTAAERTFSSEEANKLYQVLLESEQKKPTHMQVYAVELAMMTGMRVGELAGLYWSDIDYENGILNISKSEKHDRVTNEYHISETKNAKERFVPLTDQMISLFKRLEQVRTKYNITSDYLFATTTGHCTPRSISECARYKCAQAKIPVKSIHAIRRTLNSRMRVNGADSVTTAALIGNTPAVNENFYTYDVSEQKYKKELIRKASLCG